MTADESKDKVQLNDKICLDRKAFYGARISENISRTPEGFLICRNVPIAKTGTQDYLGSELEIGDYPNKIFKVYREDKEVFDPASIASFEGKPFTDEHPQDRVDSDNYSAFTKGHVTNVRRGEGKDSDKLIADIIIYDKLTAEKIESGKREISCGYNCQFIAGDDGKIYQHKIRGNHIALVDDGRAGEDVSIKDSDIKIDIDTSKNEVDINNKGIQGGNDTMAKETKKNKLFGNLLKSFAKDASPEEVAEAAEMLTDCAEETEDTATEIKESGQEPTESKPNDTKDNDITALTEVCGELLAEIKKMNDSKVKDNDPLEKLEQALEETDDETADEEAVTATSEEIEEKDEATVFEEVADEKTEDCISKDTKSALLELIKAIKPVVASIKDAKQKKLVTDSMTKLVNPLLKKSKSADNYNAILQAKQNAALRMLKDSAPSDDDKDLGKIIAASRNPHYKKNT